MKRFAAIVLAVCLSLFGTFTLFGCDKKVGGGNGDESNDFRYYKYNAESDVFDKTEYLEIDGNNCSLVKNTDGITVTAKGTVSFADNSFTVTCVSELLGISITTVMSGERENNDVLRVDSQTVIGLTSTPATDNDVQYYCHDGVKPTSPVSTYTITFDGNGGKFDGDKATKSVKTNRDGTVALPEAPTRSGYVFDGYYANKTSGTTPIAASTRFDHSMTVYARWTERSVNANVFFAYDPETQKFDINDYMEIDGTSVTMVGSVDGTVMRLNGTVVFSGNSITATFVTEEYFDIQVNIVLRGEREANGVLRFDSMTVSGVGITDEDDIVLYYCPSGVRPTNPIIQEKIYEITFNAAPGKFSDNTQVKTVQTDKNGKVTLPESPTRNGYKFKGFTSLYYDGYITADTVFRRNMTVNAEFVQNRTVTFKIEGVTVDMRTVEDGAPLGTIKQPHELLLSDDILGIMEEKGYFFFKGWYDGSKKYVSYTTVTKDVTLNAEFYVISDAMTIEQNMYELTQNGHLYIHYKRVDQTYDSTTFHSLKYDSIKYVDNAYNDWMLWAWPDGGVGRAFEPAYIGAFGIVFDIDMKKTYTDGGWDETTKTHMNKTVNFYNKGFNLQIFNNKSRMDGDPFWVNDGGNNSLPREMFDYWDVDDEGNMIGNVKYMFDNQSCHIILQQGYVPQGTIPENVFMIVFGRGNIIE